MNGGASEGSDDELEIEENGGASDGVAEVKESDGVAFSRRALPLLPTSVGNGRRDGDGGDKLVPDGGGGERVVSVGGGGGVLVPVGGGGGGMLLLSERSLETGGGGMPLLSGRSLEAGGGIAVPFAGE